MTDELAQELKGFAQALERTPVEALESAAIALNEAGLFAEKRGRALIASRLNLDTAYISKHLYFDKESTRTSLLSRIRATKRGVLAPRYGADVATTAAKSPSEFLKGDSSRRIAKGQKAAGSSPWSVLRSGTKKAWKNAFFVYLKDSGAWGMVVREGYQPGVTGKDDWDENLKVIHSMSVDQAWQGARDEVGPEAMELASAVFLKELGNRL